MRQVFRRDGHRQRERNAFPLAALHREPLHVAEVAAPQLALTGFLRPVELQVELEMPAPRSFTEGREEAVLLCDPHRVGVHEAVVDAGFGVDPVKQLEELRMEGRLAAGELEDLDVALALDHAADAPLQRFERVRFQPVARRADRRVGETGRAGEVAGIDDFDQREAGRKHLDCRIGGGGVAAERPGAAGGIGRAGAGRTAGV